MNEVAVDGSFLYVTDRLNHHVRIFDKKTFKLAATIGSCGTKPGQIGQPHGFHIDGNLLYMPEYENNRVQVWRIEEN